MIHSDYDISGVEWYIVIMNTSSVEWYMIGTVYPNYGPI